MKFFTLEVYRSLRNTYDKLHAAEKSYTQHRAELQGVLLDTVLDLSVLTGVDDGLLVRVKHERNKKRLVLVLRCGYSQIGYYDLVLTYHGTTIEPQHDRTLAFIARSTKGHRTHTSDLAYHELDTTDDGGIEHRFLFHPGVWFAICCTSLEWERVPRPDRRLPNMPDRYPGGPGPDD